MKLLIFSCLLGVALADDRAASCQTNVEGYYLDPDNPDHYIVPVGADFIASFSFFSDSASWVIEKGGENFAPGAIEDPALPRQIIDDQFEFQAIYTCEYTTGGSAGEYLHMEYGTAFPDSATCDTEFECCDVGCEIVTEFGQLPANPHNANGDWGGQACDADVCVPCGALFTADIVLHGCPDAEISVEEIGTSGADIPSIGRSTFQDEERLLIEFQCPTKRGSKNHVGVQVTDQYGGVDTCEMYFDCEWCANKCTCPMCAPAEKEWICYNDRDGDFNLVAITESERDKLDPATWIYPLEYYPGFEDEVGVQVDCWCDPICEIPPAGLTFVCHHDRARSQWHLAAVHTEERPGPMNDLADYLAAGDGFPGTHIDGGFYDCWCNLIDIEFNDPPIEIQVWT